jgi:hypothetical protein
VSIQATNDGSLYGPASTFRPFQPGFPPTAPVSTCSAALLTSTIAAVTWTPPLVQPIAPLLGYYLLSSSDNPSDTIYRYSAYPSQTSFIFSNLNPTSAYRFFVQPVNAPGYGPSLSTNTVVFNVVVTTGLLIRFDASTYSGSGQWINTGSLGTSYNATITAGQTPTKNGAGNGIVFSGTSGWTFSNIGTRTSFTISTWVKRTGTSPLYTAIVSDGTNGTSAINMAILGPHDTIPISNTQTAVGFFDTVAWRTGSTVSLPLNTWVFVCGTFDNATKNLTTYVNGTSVNTTQFLGITPTSSGQVYRIGQHIADALLYYVGEIGQVLIYNRTLSAAEVQQNYNATANTFAV